MQEQLDIPGIIIVALMLSILGGSAALWFARLLLPMTSIRQNDPIPPWTIGWGNFGLFVFTAFMAVFVVQMAADSSIRNLMGVDANGDPILTPWMAVVSIILLQAPLLAVYYGLRRIYPNQFAGQINSKSLSILEALRRAAPTFLRFLPIIWIASILWNLLLIGLQKVGLVGETPPQELIGIFASGGNPLAMSLLVLLAVIGAPLVEEIIFRGGLYRFLKSQTLIPFAQFFSSILFALMHGNLMSFGPLLIVGIILAHVYESEGNLKVAICFHALFNSFTLMILLLASQTTLIPPTPDSGHESGAEVSRRIQNGGGRMSEHHSPLLPSLCSGLAATRHPYRGRPSQSDGSSHLTTTPKIFQSWLACKAPLDDT